MEGPPLKNPQAGIPVALIVAAAENGVIGRCGTMPWRLSSDPKAFRRRTMGKPVIMGRKTFCSLPKPLDGRDSIVITRDSAFAASLAAGGAHTALDLPAALQLAATFAAKRNACEIMVIGGASIYAEALAFASRIYLTRVHGSPEGDVRFPPLDPGAWREASREDFPRGDNDDYDFSLIVLERTGAPAPREGAR
jgi:dihydrofolate reductase